MDIPHLAASALRTLTMKKAGPTLYDLCDPVLLRTDTGDEHLRRFYKRALRHPALRPVLARAGLPQLRDEARFRALQAALVTARDDAAPDWRAIGEPLAALIDDFPQRHPNPPARTNSGGGSSTARLDEIIRACADHLLGAFDRHGFIPTYAAFNLVGDPDFRGRDLLMALEGLRARTYKNATLLFNLARVFILANPPVAALLNPPWKGIAEPMWSPVQIRHRSAYYDAFFSEALMDFCASGLGTDHEVRRARQATETMIRFCLETSREEVPGPDDRPISVVTALAPPPHAQLTPYFQQIKSDLGFGLYVPDCDTTACSLSAATQFGWEDPMLDQPMLEFYAKYQVGRSNEHPPTVAINDGIGFDGGIVTWIQNLAGDEPYGNDLDPTLNLDVLEVSFRNHARWRIVETPQRLDTVQRILRFQRRLVESGAFEDPRSHIYYLPELFCAYVGRCHAAFRAMPEASQRIMDPEGTMEALRHAALGYAEGVLSRAEMNPFDAALALLALSKLGADPRTFEPALAVIAGAFGEGGRRAPFKAYEWNKMKTPTRILVGGPEVTSAFVLSALVHAREALRTN
ncbi:MAG TPA: hypothetical protein VGU24_08560 [Microvirga sp.]|jgi:hypothetical protein|nr:hypothetical protein [Microvirga sp.]